MCRAQRTEGFPQKTSWIWEMTLLQKGNLTRILEGKWVDITGRQWIPSSWQPECARGELGRRVTASWSCSFSKVRTWKEGSLRDQRWDQNWHRVKAVVKLRRSWKRNSDVPMTDRCFCWFTLNVFLRSMGIFFVVTMFKC